MTRYPHRFETCTKAALAKDGATAVSAVTDHSLKAYEDFRRLVLTGAELEIRTPREDGTWKFDQMSMVEVVGFALGDVAQQRGFMVDQLIEQILVEKYGSARTEELHEPVGA